MSTELATIRGIVRSLDGKNALVEIEQGGCGRCHEPGGCGGQQLTQIFCSGPKAYSVENTIGAVVGDGVTIAIAAVSVRRTANLAYGVPLVAIIAGAVLGASAGGDFLAMVGAAIGLIFSILYIIFRSKDGTGNMTERPYIISRS